MDSHSRMMLLIALAWDKDPEHGDTHALDNFLSENADDVDEDFDVFAFRDANADAYADYLEEYLND